MSGNRSLLTKVAMVYCCVVLEYLEKSNITDCTNLVNILEKEPKRTLLKRGKSYETKICDDGSELSNRGNASNL